MKTLNAKWMNGYWECQCGGLVYTTTDWLGEDENGVGHFEQHETCEHCGAFQVSIVEE